MPTISNLKEVWGIDQTSLETYLTEDKNNIADNLQELLGPEREIFVKIKSTLDQNIFKLYRIIWGQCNPALNENIFGLDAYGMKSNEYECMWLFKHLNSSNSGTNRSQ